MSEPVCVQVALLAPLYQNYTYSVPADLAAAARPGCRVVAPLGGRHANGVIVAATATPPVGVTLKEILEVVDEEPLVDPPRLELAQWIAHRYFAPPGECIRLFFPPGSYVDATFAYFPAMAGRGRAVSSSASPTFQDKLLALVAARPGVTGTAIRREIQAPGLERALASLEKRGLIRKESRVLGARTGFRQVYEVELLRPDVEPAPFPVRQRSLLEFLRTHQGPLPLGRVLHESGAPRNVARSLEKKGLLRIYQRESYRSPFDGYADLAPERLTLTPAQAEVVERIRSTIGTDEPGQFLLFGVTGSGKTQVYIELIQAALARGRTALVLVPEISLTPAMTRRFLSHFGPDLAILHSMLSDGERHDQWFRVRRGQAHVVIGTRSALFAPLNQPGVIILDEEHDSSYKQDETPRYHARDIARHWAARSGATLVLGSATPSVESFHAAVEAGELELLELPERILNRPLPVVRLVDMSQEFNRYGKNVILAGEVYKAVAERMKRREQVMVLLNRRGFAPVLLCRKCGHTFTCVHCNISLTYHHGDQRLLCHYCGYLQARPEVCPECGSVHLFYLGAGTEKLEEIFRLRFPGRTVERFDRDTTRRRGSMKEILDRFDRREIDLLVGTQMIAKGHDFPAVTLVVVLSTDTSLRIPDFRSAERTFQLLTQVAGRSGRGTVPGDVYIQTYFPNHYAVQHARSQDYRRFYEREAGFRRQLFYPPYTRLVFLVIRDRKEARARRVAERAGKHLRAAIGAHGNPAVLRVLGPAPALLEKIKDEFRFSILIRCLNMDGLYEVLSDFRRRCLDDKLPFQRITIDVDPTDLV